MKYIQAQSRVTACPVLNSCWRTEDCVRVCWPSALQQSAAHRKGTERIDQFPKRIWLEQQQAGACGGSAICLCFLFKTSEELAMPCSGSYG